MKLKEMRFRVSDHLWKRYKVLCVKNNLSVPKQSAELIRKFVEVAEVNQEFIKGEK